MEKLILHDIINKFVVFNSNIRIIPLVITFCLLLVLDIDALHYYGLTTLPAHVSAQETPVTNSVCSPDIQKLQGTNITTTSNLVAAKDYIKTGVISSSQSKLSIPDPKLGKSPNGYNSPHCTWWVDWCVSTNNGNNPTVDFRSAGCAAEWWNGVEYCQQSSTPVVGSVMVIGSCARLLAGHVAYVIAVQDNKHFTITHANYPWPTNTAPHISICTINAAGEVIIDSEQHSLPLLGFLRPPGY